MKQVILGTLLASLLLPADADAQRRGRYNPFSFEPYIGAYWDAYDLEADGSNLGYLIGFRAGYQPGDRTNLQLNLGYAQANDVASRAPVSSPVFDNQWVLALAGADFALVPGNTSVAIGASAGVGWRRTPLHDPDSDRFNDDGWGTYDVVAPALTIRHRFSQRAALWGSFQDFIFDVLENNPQHSFALTAGLSFR